jgi:hypothetical protein
MHDFVRASARATLTTALLFTLVFAGCATHPPLDTPVPDGLSRSIRPREIDDGDIRLRIGQMEESLALPAAALENTISEIRSEYLLVPRLGSDRRSLAEMKYALLSWEDAMIRRILADLARDPDTQETRALLRALLRLGPVLNDEEIANLEILRDTSSDISQEIAAIILSLQQELDFAPYVPPSRHSSWDWKRISVTDELSIDNYPYEWPSRRVMLRGAALESGDILLVHLKNPSEGLFTAFAEEPNYTYHAAMYLELEGENGIFPVVFESYERGIRVVPAASYFRADHTAFIEVMRWDPAVNTPRRRARLEEVVISALGESWGFNITLDDAVSDSDNYISCVTALTTALARAGYPVPETRTGISSAARENFLRVGTEAMPFLSPSDFLSMPELTAVAIVDNRGIDMLLAAALANDHLRRQFEEKTLEPDDGDWRFYRGAVRNVQNRTFLVAPVILGIFGYNQQTFPLGTAEILALVLRLEEEMDPAVEAMEEYLGENRDVLYGGGVVSISALLADPWYRDLAAGAMAGTDAFFSP